MKTITRWKKKGEFESSQEHNTIQLDGNRENGFGPKALMLSSLAGCSGIDIVDILEKMRITFTSIEIEVEAKLSEEHPKVFTEIMMIYKIGTDPANEEKLRKAIDLSLEKYCGVAAMLKKNSPVYYTLIII